VTDVDTFLDHTAIVNDSTAADDAATSVTILVYHFTHTYRFKAIYTRRFLESRPVNKEKVLTTSQAINLLKQRGYLIKDEPLPTS